MNIKYLLMPVILWASYTNAFAQTSNEQKDSLYIHQIENKENPDKVLHAEPLYIDLIRDLGARKGEKEWNVGVGIKDRLTHDSYEALIEYEWAPINRLGLEVELPFTFYSPVNGTEKDSVPKSQLNSLKLAAQWSFFVNESIATSMALGYINEVEISHTFKTNKYLKGNVYNPFLVIAKRWGTRFHTLLYTGPKIEQSFFSQKVSTHYEINSSMHYMIPGTRNFIGLEFNKSLYHGNFDMTIHPQMRLGVADNLLVGIVAGVPVIRKNERLSSFVRLIWEPGHKHK